MTRHLARRAAASSAAATLTLAALAIPASASVVDDELPSCTPGDAPGLQNGVSFVDHGTAVLVGGDYRAHAAAAESEGLLAVAGTTTIDAGLFNVGRAGVGSGIVPTGDALLSGGDLIVDEASRLDVNHGVDGGGDVRSGGSVTGEIEDNGGAVVEDDASVAPTVDRSLDVLRSLSADLGSLAPTGDLDTGGAYPTLVGDGTSDPQVFDLTVDEAADLDSYVLTDLGGAALVINVRGSEARLDTTHAAAERIESRIDDPTGSALGAWAPRILWNFTDATALQLAGGSQLVGSVLAPRADVVQTAHTNGRLWVGGDLDLGPGGSGLEHHNYPWTGADETSCETPDVPTTEPSQQPEVEPEEPTTAEPDEPSVAPSEPAEPGGPDESTGPSEPTSEPQETTTSQATDESTPSAQDTSPAATTVTETGAELPRTGSTTTPLLAVGGALLALGGGLLLWRRLAR